MTGYLALTFGTLLSSQGTDAHQSRSRDLSWGNRSTLCPFGLRCQSAVLADHLPRMRPLRRSCERVAPGPAADVASGSPRGVTTLRTVRGDVKSGPETGRQASNDLRAQPAGSAGRDLDACNVALALAQHQPSSVQQIRLVRGPFRVVHASVVDVGAALGDRPPCG